MIITQWKAFVILLLIIFCVVYFAVSLKKAKKTDTPTKTLVVDMLELIIPAILIIILLTKVVGVSTIQSGSMEPTLNVGSTVFYNRLCYSLLGEEINRGDIIVFYSIDENKYLSKRVIGIPGDDVAFKDGYVVLNGEIFDESGYLAEEIKSYSEKSFDVPENCYFVLGDNRAHSNDSRFWMNPYVDKKEILGRYMGQIDFSFQYDVLYRLWGNTP